MAMLASPAGIRPSRCWTATRVAGQRLSDSVRMRSISASAISSYAEYSIAETGPSWVPRRTEPRKTAVPPSAGSPTRASKSPRAIGDRVR